MPGQDTDGLIVGREIRDAVLDAEYNFRYWRYMTVKYLYRERYLMIFLASTSSSTVAGWGIWQDAEVVWKLLSGLSAIIAIALPILGWSTWIQNMAKLTSQWQQLLLDREELYLDFKSPTTNAEQIRTRLYALKKREVQLDSELHMIPYDEKTAEKSQAEVRRSRAAMLSTTEKEQNNA